jgi:hypothetical protein
MRKMNQFEVISQQIVEYINDPIQRATRLISPCSGTRFVVCGTSGSGKTRAIDLANELLPADAQIAESRELVSVSAPSKAQQVLENPALAYEESLHIGFAVYSRTLAEALQSEGIKVFWLDGGNTRAWHNNP